jgi:GeoRSP system SPASM domain protein
MKLAAPLRVTWDWNWPPVVQPGTTAHGPGKKRAVAIGGELARARVLLLEVGYPGFSSVHSGFLRSVLEGVGAQVSLVLTPETIASLQADDFSPESFGAAEVWVDVTPGGEEKGNGRALPRSDDGSVWTDIRLYLTSSNWRKSAVLLAKAVEGGARRLSLPILPLFGSFLTSAGTPVPSWRDLVEFSNLLEPLLRSFPDLELRVHHQALWTLLAERGIRAGDGEAPGHSGCQAAGALAYIDPRGNLYPCNALPLPLGGVEPGIFEAVWKNDERRRLRESIEQVPSACEGCRRWQSCRGGCRGWAHCTAGAWDAPGPDCGREMDEAGTAR